MRPASCPRCPRDLSGAGLEWSCEEHGRVPPLLRPAEASYHEFAGHLTQAGQFPTYLPWPLGPGWAVTDFGVVTEAERTLATLTCCSGTSALDGPVDVFVIAEESAVGLGSRCAGLARDDPLRGLRTDRPTVRVRIGSQAVPLWVLSTSAEDSEFDRSVCVGEADGRWLWLVLRPASAMLLLRDDWILRDVSGVGPPLVEMEFGGPRPGW